MKRKELRGLPFNIQGGGGSDIGMDQNIFFNMIQLMVIFFKLLTNYLFQPLVERLSKIANVLFIKAI